MQPFSYDHASDLASASRNAAVATSFIAGGTSMLDLMKLNVMRPAALVDINTLATPGMHVIEASGDRLRIGALARMADVAAHADVARHYPLVAQSLAMAASAQLRNMASIAGNVLQRTRCSYFRDVSWAACNKREPGSGCAALGGFNRLHAVLGGSDQCIASYPGDFAQTLAALDASVHITGPTGERVVRFEDLHRRPGAAPQVETNLEPGDIITTFEVAGAPWMRRSAYVKVRDRASYAFAITSVAIALDLDGDIVRHVRLALGGVATVPWRAHEAEAALTGKPLTPENASAAAKAAYVGAQPYKHNAFKIPLGEATIVRALMQTAALQF